MKTNDIKKGTKIKSVQLGTPVTAIMMDNLRGNTRFVDVKGSEVGMFDDENRKTETNDRTSGRTR